MELYLLNGSIMLTGLARNETSLNRTLGLGSAFGTERMLSPTGYTTTGVVLAFISVFGIVNNFFVFLVLLRNRPLRTPVNLMILSLSLSDFIIAAFGTPLTAGAAFAGKWIYGDGLCVAYAFCMALTGISSITTLAVISMERYLLVSHPGAITITTRKTFLACVFVWTYAFAVTFPPVVGWSRMTLESPGIACAPNWESQAPIDLSYEIYLLFFGLVCPLSIIIWSYASIIHFIRQQAQSGVGQGAAKSQKRLTQMVALMVTCFLVAWLPYALVSVIVMAGGVRYLSATATTVPALLAKSSLIYNPIIYAFMNPQLRGAFLTLIGCSERHMSLLQTNKERPRHLPEGFSQVRTGHAEARKSSSISSKSRKSFSSGTRTPQVRIPPSGNVQQSPV